MSHTTSEERFELPEQPSETCPMIDDVIKKINSALKNIKGYERSDDADELRNMISDVEWDLGDLESELENIRSHVVKIREWGQAWKVAGLELEETIDLGKDNAT